MMASEAPRATQLEQPVWVPEFATALRVRVYEIKIPDMKFLTWIAGCAQDNRGLKPGVIRPVMDKNTADYAVIGA